MPHHAGLVVVTGANRGIGLGLCETYHAAGCNVLAVCRSVSNALATLGVEIVSGVWSSTQSTYGVSGVYEHYAKGCMLSSDAVRKVLRRDRCHAR